MTIVRITIMTKISRLNKEIIRLANNPATINAIDIAACSKRKDLITSLSNPSETEKIEIIPLISSSSEKNMKRLLNKTFIPSVNVL